MTDWLEDCLFNLAYLHQRILLEFLEGEDLIDIFTEIHPLYALLPPSFRIHSVNLQQFLELLIRKRDVLAIENAPELQASDNVLP